MTQRTASQRLIALAGLAVIVGVAVVVLLAADVLGNQGGGEGIENVELVDTPASPAGDLDVGPEKGKLAPDFVISDFDGSRHRLSDLRGQVVYVNFWATWCVPCQIELPDIVRLERAHSDDLVVITVNRSESLDDAREFFRNLPNLEGGEGVDFTINGMDPDDTLYDRYRALGMPASFFVSPDGVVTDVANGLITYEEMEGAVAQALGDAD